MSGAAVRDHVRVGFRETKSEERASDGAFTVTRKTTRIPGGAEQAWGMKW